MSRISGLPVAGRPDRRPRVALRGAGPERTIQTGIGAIPVRRPKVRDRATDAAPGAKIRVTPPILPGWARRTRCLDALPPVLYLRGVSTGDFREALSALPGADAPPDPEPAEQHTARHL